MWFLTCLPKHQVSLARLCTHLLHVAPGQRKEEKKAQKRNITVESLNETETDRWVTALPECPVDLADLDFL